MCWRQWVRWITLSFCFWRPIVICNLPNHHHSECWTIGQKYWLKSITLKGRLDKMYSIVQTTYATLFISVPVPVYPNMQNHFIKQQDLYTFNTIPPFKSNSWCLISGQECNGGLQQSHGAWPQLRWGQEWWEDFFCDWPMTNDHPLVVDHHGVNCLWTGYRDCAIRMQSGGGGGKDPEEVILIIIIIIIINNWENET